MNVYLVVIFLDEATERQAKALVGSDAPIHGIDGPWRLVFVDLFSFTVQRHFQCLYRGGKNIKKIRTLKIARFARIDLFQHEMRSRVCAARDKENVITISLRNGRESDDLRSDRTQNPAPKNLRSR